MSKRSRSKGKYCAVYGCNTSSADKVSLFLFPNADRQPEIRKKWILFVKQKRSDFCQPSQYMCVCEKHFEESCFPMKYKILKSMGKENEIGKKTLLAGAIPTINPSSVSEGTNVGDSASGSKPRSAFRKRECQRILQNYESEIAFEASSTAHLQHGSDIDEDDHDIPIIQKTTRGTQLKSLKPPRRSASCQTKPNVRSTGVQANFCLPASESTFLEDVGVQCSMDFAEIADHDVIIYPSSYAIPPVSSKLSIDLDQSISDEEDLAYQDDSSDMDFTPSESDSESDADVAGRNSSPYQERKYIVFESNLLSLFTICPTCHGTTTACIKRRIGSMISIHQECSCGYILKWSSQPLIGNIPGGNLLMSASILFSGSTPTKALRLFDQMNVAAISRRTFTSHQSMYLHPVVNHCWKTFQSGYFDEMRRKRLPITIGGDGRADTPGHSAKFGSYTFLDLDYMLVIEIQLVQSNEVKSSYHMELEGMKRGISRLYNEKMNIGEVITDRHIQINKYVREEMPQATHYFDVWHVAKGMKKKLTALSRLKECDSITPWIKSIANHIYWVPASTPDGHQETMVEKWTSLLNHITNVHTHNGQHFHKCEHGTLERKKKWLIPGTTAYEKLQDVLLSKQMMKDVKKLSPGAQTSSLEAFHSVVNQFAPKMIGFSYCGMYSRIVLAALHYNENRQREQAFRKDGNKRCSIIFPKYKKGDYVLREEKVQCTYGYVHNLMDALTDFVMSYNHDNAERLPVVHQPPPPLCSNFKRPRLEDVSSQSRYK